MDRRPDCPKIESYHGPDMCLAQSHGLGCTLAKGHEGPHAAHGGSDSWPLATWTNEDDYVDWTSEVPRCRTLND